MGFTTKCVFCDRQAISKNNQGFPVCVIHKKDDLPEMKCVCGEFLNIKDGKYGAFFLCPGCGPVSVKKALSVNEVPPPETKNSNIPREITLRSDEVDLY